MTYHPNQKPTFRKILEDTKAKKKIWNGLFDRVMKLWNLYIFRHSALTEKSHILKESTLLDHAGLDLYE